MTRVGIASAVSAGRECGWERREKGVLIFLFFPSCMKGHAMLRLNGRGTIGRSNESHSIDRGEHVG